MHRFVFVLVFAGLASSGCGGGLQIGQVTGRVTFGGKNVPGGIIMFHPANGPTAVGDIRNDGTYTLTTIKPGDGAIIGMHRVTIQSTRVGSGQLVEPKRFEDELNKGTSGNKILVPGKVEWLVPQRYSQLDTTDLRATVQLGSQTIDFAISDKSP
jgi:hypothetical protein